MNNILLSDPIQDPTFANATQRENVDAITTEWPPIKLADETAFSGPEFDFSIKAGPFPEHAENEIFGTHIKEASKTLREWFRLDS